MFLKINAWEFNRFVNLYNDLCIYFGSHSLGSLVLEYEDGCSTEVLVFSPKMFAV